MMNYRCNRREFLSHSGAGIAGLVGGQWLGGATTAHGQGADVTPRDPDLVVFNAKVYTVDSRVTKAEAFAVKGGRFVAVGRSDEIKGLVGKKTQTYDARQMMIVPGFIDTHNHGRGEVLLYNVLVGNSFDVEFVTIQSIIDKLRARAATTPPGTWVEGYFFDDTKLKDNRSAVRRGMATFESATDTWLHLGQVALCAAKMRKRTTNSRSNNRGSWIVVLDADGLAGTGKEGTGVISEDSGQNTVRLRLYKTAG